MTTPKPCPDMPDEIRILKVNAAGVCVVSNAPAATTYVRKDLAPTSQWRDFERIDNLLEDICSIAFDTGISKQAMRDSIRENCQIIAKLLPAPPTKDLPQPPTLKEKI